MADKGVAFLGCRELAFLQCHIGGHLFLHIALGQAEHVVPHAVNTGQSDELEPIAHGGKLFLEAADGVVIKVGFPIK